jgi:hypothetical protein
MRRENDCSKRKVKTHLSGMSFKKKSQRTQQPTDDDPIVEDTMLSVDMGEEDGPDDSDITPAEVVANIVGRRPRRDFVRQANGGGLLRTDLRI